MRKRLSFLKDESDSVCADSFYGCRFYLLMQKTVFCPDLGDNPLDESDEYYYFHSFRENYPVGLI